jgi:NADH-quinone oxidoreductase subunit E
MTTDAPSFLSEAMQLRFAREVAKFPADQKQSAVMACLAIVQEAFGFVSQDSELAVADYLGMPPIAVHEVTTFYNMYNQQPLGRYKLNVCTNCATASRHSSTSARAWAWKRAARRPTACSPCRRANAWAPAPMHR